MMKLRATGRHRRPPPRQQRPARTAVVVLALLTGSALGTAAGELHAHGFGQFAFRPPGTGATRNDLPSPSPAPVPARPSVILVIPYLQHHPKATIIVPVTDGEVLSVTDRPPGS